MVSGWAAGVRFLWRKQGVSPLPLSIGEVMSLHPRKDTTRNRVCKHALGFIGFDQLSGACARDFGVRLLTAR
jgi:hypothetical protein